MVTLGGLSILQFQLASEQLGVGHVQLLSHVASRGEPGHKHAVAVDLEAEGGEAVLASDLRYKRKQDSENVNQFHFLPTFKRRPTIELSKMSLKTPIACRGMHSDFCIWFTNRKYASAMHNFT